MAQMTYEEFSKRTNQGSTLNQTLNKSFGPSYFSLKEDGDTAIVRFNIADIKEVIVHSQHTLKIEDKWRKIECLRTFNEPVDNCPLCKDGNKQQFRIYLELLVYDVKDNRVVATPSIWETAAKFRETLKSYFMDYGDLRNVIFKLTRVGKKGDTKTTYTLIPANPQIYRNEDYVADFTAFDNFDVHKYMLLNKTKKDLEYLVANGSFPVESNQSSANKEVSTRVSAEQHQQHPKQFSQQTTNFRNNLGDTSQPIRTVYREVSQDTENQTEQKSPRRYTY